MTYYSNAGLQVTRSRKLFLIAGAIVAATVAAISAVAFQASAVSQVVVTPSDTQGWSTADTRPGGTVDFVSDSTAPAGSGALELKTDGTNAAKAQYLHEANVALGDVTELSYSSKTLAGPVHAAPSYQLVVDLNGGTLADGGFTTFVYEPYQNGSPVVTPNVWNSWDVDAGEFWSSKTFTDGSCAVQAGAGGTYFYTLADLQADCPDAVAIGFGVNVGSYNPGYDVYTDLVSFNGVAYDFEAASYKDQCKTNWQTLGYKNQGQCVASVVSNENSKFNQ